MSDGELLPDNFDTAKEPELKKASGEMQASTDRQLIEILYQGCESSVMGFGEFTIAPTALIEKWMGHPPPDKSPLSESEFDMLEALSKSKTGITGDALAVEIGLPGRTGQFGVWVDRLKAHGFIKSGGSGRGSKGYRITVAGQDALDRFRNSAE